MDIEAFYSMAQEGVRLLDAQEFSQAREVFDNLMLEHQTPSLYHVYSVICVRMGADDDALAAIDKAIAMEPGNSDAYDLKLDILKRQSRHQEVIECANELLVVAPNKSGAIHDKAQAYQKIGKPYLADREKRHFLNKVYDNPPSIENLSANDIDYHIRQIALRRTPFIDYPSHVQFETFAQCNAACSFCVYPDMARKGQMMPMDIIDKIISDLQEIPPHVKFQLSPFAVNEPFLDVRIFEILDKITAKLPNAGITLTSNASPITPQKLKRLAQYKLDYLWLSVVDYRKDVYEREMKLPFDRLLSRLKMIHEAKAEGWFSCRVVVSRLIDNSEHDLRYKEFMNEHFPLFEVALWPYANWLGQTKNETSSAISDIPCSHWFEFRVDAKGIVQHCCMDGHSEYPWGDVTKDSVLKIYNQPNYRRLRESVFSRLQVSPCNTCNLR